MKLYLILVQRFPSIDLTTNIKTVNECTDISFGINGSLSVM